MAVNREAAQMDKEDAPSAGLFEANDGRAAILEIGGTANSASPKWLRGRNLPSAEQWLPAADVYLSTVTFRFGRGRLEQVHFASDVPAAIAGYSGPRVHTGPGGDGREVGLAKELFAPCEIGIQNGAPRECGGVFRFECWLL